VQIKDYVDNDVNINRANDFVEIPAGEEQVVFQDLTKLYGEPEIQKNVLPLNTLPRWIVNSETHYYEFDAGHDDQEEYSHAPYGLSLYSAMNPIKEARYHGVPKIIAQIEQAIKDAESDSEEFPAQFEIDDVEQTIRDISARYEHKANIGPGESESYPTWLGVGRIPTSIQHFPDNSGKDIYRIDVTVDVDNKVVEVY
jgi:hypothetical protein